MDDMFNEQMMFELYVRRREDEAVEKAIAENEAKNAERIEKVAAESEAKGEVNGAFKRTIQMAINLLKLPLSIEQIMEVTGLPKDEIQKLANSMQHA